MVAVKMSRICDRVVMWRAATAFTAVVAMMLAVSGPARAASGADTGLRAVPRSSRELIVVTAPRASATSGTLTAEVRSAPGARWRRVLGPWPAELGRRGLSAHRQEGDGTTPLGIFAIAPTLYGNAPRPRGLRERYRRLGCGDWWDEDPDRRVTTGSSWSPAALPRGSRRARRHCGPRRSPTRISR